MLRPIEGDGPRIARQGVARREEGERRRRRGVVRYLSGVSDRLPVFFPMDALLQPVFRSETLRKMGSPEPTVCFSRNEWWIKRSRLDNPGRACLPHLRVAGAERGVSCAAAVGQLRPQIGLQRFAEPETWPRGSAEFTPADRFRADGHKPPATGRPGHRELLATASFVQNELPAAAAAPPAKIHWLGTGRAYGSRPSCTVGCTISWLPRL